MNTIKNIICICTVLMMSLSLAACSDKKAEEPLLHNVSSKSTSASSSTSEPDNPSINTDKIKTYYEQNTIDVSDNLCTINQIKYSDGNLYLLGQKRPENSGSDTNDLLNEDHYLNVLSIITSDGKSVRNIDLPEGNYNADMTVTSDGTAYVLINYNITENTNNGPVETTQPDILCIKKDGTVKTIYHGKKINEKTQYIFSADSKGNVCLLSTSSPDDSIFHVKYISNTGEQSDITYIGDGFVRKIICPNDEFYIQFQCAGRPVFQFLNVDKENMKINETEEININMDEIIDGNNGYDLYYPSGSNIYGYDIADRSSDKNFSWFESDVLSVPTGEQNITIADSDNIFYFNTTQDNYQYTSENRSSIDPPSIVHLKKVDQTRLKELNDLNVITLAGTDLYGQFQTIKEFNNNNKDYFIMATDYSQYDGSMREDAQAELNALKTDIDNGNIPDVILGSQVFDVQNYLNRNSFADLNDLLRNDTEINSSDLAENILDACSYNGKLYMIPTMTDLQTLTLSEEYTDNKQMLTYDEFLSLLDKFSDQVLMHPSKENVLEFLLPSYLEENIDHQKASCNFDTDLFKEILEKTKTYVKKNKEYLDENDDGTMPEYPLEEIYYRFSGDFVSWIIGYNGHKKSNIIKGIPSSSGKVSLMNVYQYLCMTESSDNKECAWNFIKYFNYINDEGNSMERGFSIIHSRNQKLIDSSTSELFPGPVCSKSSPRKYDDVTESHADQISDSSEADSQRYRNAVDTLWNGKMICTNNYSGLISIITEEADKYYDGIQSLDYTVSAIQNEVTLYLSEIG